MTWKSRYDIAKERLLADASINKTNRELFRKFFEFEEYKLKRKNGLASLDEGCLKTLYTYIVRFRNVNMWFRNKPLAQLTKADIKRVYDDLEEGRIRNHRDQPFVDRHSYYNKVLKSKLFQMVGKDGLAREVIEYSTNTEKEVRFVDDASFRKLVSVVAKPEHLLLLWLAWDIGENVNTLLQLRREHFRPQQNTHTKEREYLVSLPRPLLKRSRTSRSEPMLYQETVQLADIVLAERKEGELVFQFEYRQALKFFKAAALRCGVQCQPTNDIPSWKDLRSGMACHLLREGWTTDEVNFRLGHKPSSREIDVYVSYLAIDRSKPKKKLFDSSLAKVQGELDEARARERLLAERMERQREETEALRRQMVDTQAVVRQVKEALQLKAGKHRGRSAAA